MTSRRTEEVRALLADKFKREKLRLKSYDTKANSFDLAHAVTQYVRALMSEARYYEIRGIQKHIESAFPKKKLQLRKLGDYLQERRNALKEMSAAIQHMADDMEAKRPWKPKDQPKRKKKKRRQR